jgi:hypothetical protein
MDSSAVVRHDSSALSLSREVAIISWKPLNCCAMASSVVFRDSTDAAISR